MINAFSHGAFSGSPTAVCWIGDNKISSSLMQSIASEINLSETAFISYFKGGFNQNSKFYLKWFTPKHEVITNGHATLAAAHSIFSIAENINDSLTFITEAGDIMAHKIEDSISLDFPQNKPEPVPEREFRYLFKTMFSSVVRNTKIADVRLSRISKKLVIRMTDDFTMKDMESLNPHFRSMLEAHDGSTYTGVIVTCRGQRDDKYHFYSRYFAPWDGVNEEAVSGCAHAVLAPYWSAFIGKKEMLSRQCSARGGELRVKVKRDGRIDVFGKAHAVIHGTFKIPVNRLNKNDQYSESD